MKKFLFESQELLFFIIWWVFGFWINIWTNKLSSASIWTGILIIIISISLFLIYKIWIWKLDKFNYYITHWKWEKKNFWWKTTWICSDTDEYQLVLWEDVTKNFKEPRTKIFPDNENNFSCELFLKKNWIIVREFIWVYLDWVRTFIPIPNRKYWENENQDYFYFRKDSIEYKMMLKIWDLWREANFESLFKRAKINLE